MPPAAPAAPTSRRAGAAGDPLAGDVAVDERLGQPLGDGPRAREAPQPPAERGLTGPSAVTATTSRGGPRRTCRRRPPAPAVVVAQARATSDSSYWRRTLNARTTTGRTPSGKGTSNPPDGEPQPRSLERPGGLHARRVDLDAHHLDVAPHPSQSVVRLDRRDRGRALAEVDHDRRAPGIPTQPPRLWSRQPEVAAAEAVGVRRAPGDDPDRSLLRHHPSLGSSRPAPRSAGPGAQPPGIP